MVGFMDCLLFTLLFCTLPMSLANLSIHPLPGVPRLEENTAADSSHLFLDDFNNGEDQVFSHSSGLIFITIIITIITKKVPQENRGVTIYLILKNKKNGTK